ncbi:MAG TPA: glutamate 5-kinase [Anaerolineaceae bacterium]|nr:glutamate 5-kinase [Anaerolineaceae bacterium]
MVFQRIVIKFGTSTLTAGTPFLELPHILDLVRQIARLHADGCEVILVSSGAVATGRQALNFPELPKFIPSKQMLSAIGQPRLMGIYDQFFRIYDKTVAQVLLTRSDLIDRHRYLNARNTLEALLSLRVIPIINENDTVATDEIRFGDNDNLSALVANLIEADLLVMLTDQPGLFTNDPRRDNGARLIDEINTPEIPPEIWQAAGGTNSALGTGGMYTKLSAADLARRSGTTVVIAGGMDPDVLLRVAAGEALGTRLTALVTTLESRKRYLLAGKKSSGVLQIDDGAAQAILQGGSLLPVGVKEVKGKFERGDTVRIMTLSGKEVALGLVNYSAKDLAAFYGRQSAEIERLLGYTFGDEVIHRNNMLLL